MNTSGVEPVKATYPAEPSYTLVFKDIEQLKHLGLDNSLA